MIDEEGFCTICGRIKDIIIRGGENINPLEVEQVMYTHPKIKDVQVSVLNCPRFLHDLWDNQGYYHTGR